MSTQPLSYVGGFVKCATEDDDEDEDSEGVTSSANGGATVPAKPNTTANTASKATATKYRLFTFKEIFSPTISYNSGNIKLF
jgi:hypothetical protein